MDLAPRVALRFVHRDKLTVVWSVGRPVKYKGGAQYKSGKAPTDDYTITAVTPDGAYSLKMVSTDRDVTQPWCTRARARTTRQPLPDPPPPPPPQVSDNESLAEVVFPHIRHSELSDSMFDKGDEVWYEGVRRKVIEPVIETHTTRVCELEDRESGEVITGMVCAGVVCACLRPHSLACALACTTTLASHGLPPFTPLSTHSPIYPPTYPPTPHQ